MKTSNISRIACVDLGSFGLLVKYSLLCTLKDIKRHSSRKRALRCLLGFKSGVSSPQIDGRVLINGSLTFEVFSEAQFSFWCPSADAMQATSLQEQHCLPCLEWSFWKWLAKHWFLTHLRWTGHLSAVRCLYQKDLNRCRRWMDEQFLIREMPTLPLSLCH